MQAPLKQSPLHLVIHGMGAEFGPHHGWNIALSFGSTDAEAKAIANGVSISDASWLGKLEIKGRNETLEKLTVEGGKSWKLAQGHHFIACDPERSSAIVQSVVQQGKEQETEDTAKARCVHAIDVTSAFAGIVIAGPRSRDVLERLTAPDVSDDALPDGSCLSAKVAGLHARVIRDDLDEALAYWLFIGTEYAAYAWEAIMHAGRPFGMVPVGCNALMRARKGGA